MIFLKILLLLYVMKAQSEFGSVFVVIDSIPSIELQCKPKLNLISFSYNDNFNISNTNEFTGLLSLKTYKTIISIKSFDIKVFRQSEFNLSSFYEFNLFTLGSKLSYKNQWFKGFENIDEFTISPSIEYFSFVNLFISFKDIYSSVNKYHSTSIVFGKDIAQTYIQLHLNYYRERSFERVTLVQKFNHINLYIGFQNGVNEYLSGLEFHSSSILFRFAYEVFNELGIRTEIGLSFFY